MCFLIKLCLHISLCRLDNELPECKAREVRDLMHECVGELSREPLPETMSKGPLGKWEPLSQETAVTTLLF